MKRSTLLSLDAFAKTEEDVRVRTKAGGLITLSCILTTLFLLVNEWRQFNSVVTRPQLVVDRDRHAKLELNMDVTFPSMPCELVNLDIMDDSGELQLDILDAGFTMTRVDKDGHPVGDATELHVGGNGEGATPNDDPNYCGQCYGARDQSNNENLAQEDKVCCQNCDSVRSAYLDKGWAFFDGKDIEQCEKEGYVNKINDHLHEGCRIEGSAQINRIQGNIHFAPGKPFQDTRGNHRHDTSLYDKTPDLNFNHIINRLSFGKPIQSHHKRLGNDKLHGGAVVSTSPLDGRQVFPDRPTHFHQFSYFAKIVPTRYEYLDSTVIETAQFSATYHSRPLGGGRDQDHPNTFHARGGISGLYVFFEMSPLKVINKEQHGQTWSGFILNCITSIGGVLAVGTVMDKLFYKAQRSIWGKKSQ
ncbi:erv46p [Saccharomyces arboricola H-6]|uniref:Endoplasmic reticulum-Golgi intermediate compartment protein n=1 Tax=Saccharomyces arboricola (strain H-6 / AS 2.3317 / CBS 10644) TaxID=1160507 RepID=J8LRQ8_SACAR|nr:erv46p [Saccharomyces arboricola H-6]